jgi:aminoglycoside phosphotransferase (APT) family kinase protein
MIELTPAIVSDYLARSVKGWESIEITRMDRLPLGASRETFRIDAIVRADGGTKEEHRLILRRDPPASLVDSDRLTEYESYRSIHGHGIPVPKMIHLEMDPEQLGGAISIAEDLRGFHNSEYQFDQEPWARHIPKLANQMWTYMGKLAAVPIDGLGLEKFMEPSTVETAAKQQLDFWTAKFRRNSICPDPIMEAAIRKLERSCPVAKKLAMVHGDFRAGNFLYDDAGDIHAILDWEMAHIGDPLEDLTWSMNRGFCFAKDDRRSGLATREAAITIWEKASGMTADTDALAWYELFSCVKAQSLWASAANVWQSGENRDIILAYASWWLQNTEGKAMLEIMERL